MKTFIHANVALRVRLMLVYSDLILSRKLVIEESIKIISEDISTRERRTQGGIR